MSDTPSASFAAGAAPADVTLECDGLSIVVRKLTPVEQFRFKKVVGKFMDNPGFLTDALMAASVRRVGGAPMPFPQNEAGVEFILEKLGAEGWDKVAGHFIAQAEATSTDMEFAKN